MIRYAFMWLALGSVMAVGMIALVGGDDGNDDRVALPPVRETQLTSAARKAGCTLLRARSGRPRLNPPVDAPAGAPAARAGIYDDAPPAASLARAARRGVVVIHYRVGLDEDDVEQLHAIQRAVPKGTIVTPNATAMPYELAVTGYRRLLGCWRFSARAIDAVRLFRGRYIGRGPDRAP